MPTSNFAAGDNAYIAKLNELANASFTLSVQTANFSATKGFIYVMTTNGLTATLPAAPTAGDRIRFAAGSNVVISTTLSRNGNNINSAAVDYTLVAEKASDCELVYVNATIGWRVLDKVSNYLQSPAIAANVLTCDLLQGRSAAHAISLNANITTMTFINPPPSGGLYSFYQLYTADGTARTVAWATSVKWPGGTAPTMTSTVSKKDLFEFITADAGVTWLARIVGQNY